MDKYSIYREAQLGGRVGFGTCGAVLVVDFQPSFTDPSVPGAGDFSEAIGATAGLLEAARALSMPVLYTVVAYNEDLSDAGRFLEKCPTLKYSVSGSQLVGVDERLGRRPDEPVLVKKFASSFFGTHLASMLTDRQIDTLVVCGCTTSGCVRATVVDAMQYGYRAIVPRECVADIAAEPHEANLFDIDAKYGDVLGLSDLHGILDQLAPERNRHQSGKPREIKKGRSGVELVRNG